LKFIGLGKGKSVKNKSGERKSSRQNSRGKSRLPAEISEPTSSRLYIGNLSYAVTDSELSDFFASAGTVTSAEVITNPHNGRSKGFAFVEMGSLEEAKEAVKSLQDKELKGRPLLISGAKSRSASHENRGGEGAQRRKNPRRESPPRRSGGSSRSGDGRRRQRRDEEPPVERKPRKVEVVTSPILQVANLSDEVTEGDLMEAFRGITSPTHIELEENRTAAGIAQIELPSVEEAQRAVDILDGKSFMGQRLTITGVKSQ